MFLAALMIRVDESNEGDERAQAQMSGLLITVVLIPFVVMLWFIVKEFRNELKAEGDDRQQPATARLSSNVNLPEGQGMGTPMDGDETVDGDIESFKTVELPKAGRSAGKVKPTNGVGTTL